MFQTLLYVWELFLKMMPRPDLECRGEEMTYEASHKSCRHVFTQTNVIQPPLNLTEILLWEPYVQSLTLKSHSPDDPYTAPGCHSVYEC